MIVENVVGAGGTIAANRVAKAAADGYTILIHHIGIPLPRRFIASCPITPINDFEPIGLINEVPMTLVAKKDFPAKDLKELIAYVKANKDKVNLRQRRPRRRLASLRHAVYERDSDRSHHGSL